METTCPGAGYYPGFASYEKSEVITFAEPCSGICEFRLCQDGDRLFPCADETAVVVVRAPYLPAEGDTSKSVPFAFKHERQRLILKCQQSLGPCLTCTTADECFSGSRCEDGYCKATALCR